MTLMFPFSDVPTTLDPGQGNNLWQLYTDFYTFTDTITCSGTGATIGNRRQRQQQRHLHVKLTTDLTVTRTCFDAPQPGAPIAFMAELTNTGNEPLINITCTDNPNVPLTGIPLLSCPQILHENHRQLYTGGERIYRYPYLLRHRYSQQDRHHQEQQCHLQHHYAPLHQRHKKLYRRQWARTADYFHRHCDELW